MTVFFSDSRQQQIERGEVFFQSHTVQRTAQNKMCVIEVVADADWNVEYTLDLVLNGSWYIQINEAASTATPAIQYIPINMNRDAPNTLNAYYAFLSNQIYSAGANVTSFYVLNGKVPQNSLLNRDTGAIFKKGYRTTITLTNLDPIDRSLVISQFFRELG